LCLTRYIHMNPVIADLKTRPEDWKFSSYGENIGVSDRIFTPESFSKGIDMPIRSYTKYTNNRKNYNETLSQINHLMLD